MRLKEKKTNYRRTLTGGKGRSKYQNITRTKLLQ